MMTARSPSAFLISASIHGLFAAAMFYTAYALKDEMIDKGKIFELVAGEGDNYAATEAPALGTPGGVKFDMPAAPKPAPVFTPPEPIAAEPTPVVQAPVEAVPPPVVKSVPKAKPEPSPVAKAKPDPANVNFVKSIQRVQVRIDSKQRAQREKEAKAAALAAKNAEIAAKKAELMGQSKGGGKIAKIDAEGIAIGVLGGSTANKVGGAGGKALSRDEQDKWDAYCELVKQRIRAAMLQVDGDDGTVAIGEFHVSQAGTFSQVRILKPSGNADFDKAVLDAFSKVSSVRRDSDGLGELTSKLTIQLKDVR